MSEAKLADDDIEIVISLAQNAKNLHNSIWDVLHDIQIPNADRSVTAGQCHFLALEHFAGIASLFSEQIFAPAFALLRPLTEAFLRGAWIQLAASDDAVIKFQRKGTTPSMRDIITAVEATDVFGGGVLSRAHRANWRALCDLTHNGPEALNLCVDENQITRRLPHDNGREAINYAAAMSTLAAMGITVLADCSKSATRMLELGKSRIPF